MQLSEFDKESIGLESRTALSICPSKTIAVRYFQLELISFKQRNCHLYQRKRHIINSCY